MQTPSQGNRHGQGEDIPPTTRLPSQRGCGMRSSCGPASGCSSFLTRDGLCGSRSVRWDRGGVASEVVTDPSNESQIASDGIRPTTSAASSSPPRGHTGHALDAGPRFRRDRRRRIDRQATLSAALPRGGSLPIAMPVAMRRYAARRRGAKQNALPLHSKGQGVGVGGPTEVGTTNGGLR